MYIPFAFILIRITIHITPYNVITNKYLQYRTGNLINDCKCCCRY